MISAAPSKGAGGNGSLYSLKISQHVTYTLRHLLDILLKMKDPLDETNAQLYAPVENLLETPEGAHKAGTVFVSPPISPSPSTDPPI